LNSNAAREGQESSKGGLFNLSRIGIDGENRTGQAGGEHIALGESLRAPTQNTISSKNRIGVLSSERNASVLLRVRRVWPAKRESKSPSAETTNPQKKKEKKSMDSECLDFLEAIWHFEVGNGGNHFQKEVKLVTWRYKCKIDSVQRVGFFGQRVEKEGNLLVTGGIQAGMKGRILADFHNEQQPVGLRGSVYFLTAVGS